MKVNNSKKFFPVILLILLILVWSSVWPLFKFVTEAIPPFSFRVIIGLPACLLLFLLAFKKCKTIIIPKENWKSLFLISFFNVTLWQVLMLYGITMLGGGRAAVLTYTMPVWATIFASIFGFSIFGEIPDGWTWAGGILVFTSVLIITYRENYLKKDIAKKSIPLKS